eukprot:2405574-Alexandrium_andersonii.AAC.1
MALLVVATVAAGASSASACAWARCPAESSAAKSNSPLPSSRASPPSGSIAKAGSATAGEAGR